MRYGLIGCGAMGSAIVRGAARAGTITGNELLVCDHYAPAAEELAEELGAQIVAKPADLVASADIIILAVKPYQLDPLLRNISQSVHLTNPLLISIAGGRTLASLQSQLQAGARLVRVMPNVNALVGQSMSAVCPGQYANEDDSVEVLELFRTIGEAIVISEDKFSIFTALAGCSPAWVYTYIDALASAGVAHGLAKKEAVAIVTQAVFGSALALRDQTKTGKVPAQMVDSVCSPGGTTIAGLHAMEDRGFSAAARASVNAVVEKDQKLSQL